MPYTALVYGNGPGYRGAARVDPRLDSFPGRGGVIPTGPDASGVLPGGRGADGLGDPLGEEVAIYAIGPGSDLVRGTVKNTFIYRVMAKALGFNPGS